ncbi:MAG TPA: AlkA N-terminal domain-containing protein [Pyrinomonadaceae bacterium]|jgi:DNA-3-methyladenine glycosylase II|nr:AlkA N-terminal domain-containing protein [Pyrinomonadaceae bacterium]
MPKLSLRARAPFDFAATARFLRFADAEAVDTFARGRYRRAIHLGERLFLLTVEAQATGAQEDIDASPQGAGASREASARRAVEVTLAPERLATPEILDEAARTVRDMFSLEHDLAGWRAQLTRDPLMRRLEAEHRGLHLPRWPTLFEALTTSILLQQIATSVAITFRRRVVERFGEQLEVDGQTYFAFPRAERVARASVEELRALGLSNAKATCIVEVARACASEELSSATLAREDNESVIARLSDLRGIGRWTAEWVLMLHFGRTDVFAAADLFLRGVVVKYYNRGALMSEREIRAFASKRWGAFGSYAALYFLAGMRAGTITLKAERVLSSKKIVSAPTPKRAPRKTTNRQDET